MEEVVRRQLKLGGVARAQLKLHIRRPLLFRMPEEVDLVEDQVALAVGRQHTVTCTQVSHGLEALRRPYQRVRREATTATRALSLQVALPLTFLPYIPGMAPSAADTRSKATPCLERLPNFLARGLVKKELSSNAHEEAN